MVLHDIECVSRRAYRLERLGLLSTLVCVGSQVSQKGKLSRDSFILGPTSMAARRSRRVPVLADASQQARRRRSATASIFWRACGTHVSETRAEAAPSVHAEAALGFWRACSERTAWGGRASCPRWQRLPALHGRAEGALHQRPRRRCAQSWRACRCVDEWAGDCVAAVGGPARVEAALPLHAARASSGALLDLSAARMHGCHTQLLTDVKLRAQARAARGRRGATRRSMTGRSGGRCGCACR